MRRLRVGIVAITVALGAVVAPALQPATAGAQSTPAPTLTLAGQDPWVPRGGSFTIQFLAGGNLDGLTLAVTSHSQLSSRSDFDATLSSDRYGSTLEVVRRPLAEIPPQAYGLRTASFSLAELGITTSGNGVYPLEVQLRDDNQTVTGFVTHVVVADLASPASEPLRVAWVWPLVAEPAFRADGSADPEVVAELAETGRLGRQAAAIDRHPEVPLTLAPSPETLDSWSNLATDLALAPGVRALQAAVPRAQVLAGPFVPLDLPALIERGLGGTVITDQLSRGEEALQRFFGRHFDPSAAMPGPLDARSLDALRVASRTRLVVEGTALDTLDARLTPARATGIAARGSNPVEGTRALATDAGLEELLRGDEPPALRAAHLLAELAVIAGELPSLPRGVAFANSADWDPSDAFVDAVMDGLAGNPLIRPVTVEALLAETPLATTDDEPGGQPIVRTLAPAPPRRPPVTARQFYLGALDRAAIADLFNSENDARVLRADRVLLSVLYRGWEDAAGRAQARDLLQGVGQSVRDFLARIRTPDRSTVTLTSSRAQIPFTFRNDADRPVDIHVNLDSDKLVFPDGTDRDLTLQPGKNRTVRIAVETRSSGTFPMLMTVTTAGGLPIQTSEVTVRSSFVSGVGVFITVGAIVFLVVWWAWDIRRRRRRRRLAA
jgi:Family of unknown function (DUF6049)